MPNNLAFDRLLVLLATWFGLGKFPKMPGTIGTLGALPLVFVLNLAHPFLYMIFAVTLTIVAILVAHFYELRFGVHDNQEIVIDEVTGYVIAMTWLPQTWQSYFLAFVLFRILDALKPFPIGKLDREVKGGLGVVVDDVVAGIITNVILQIVFTKTALLGTQWIQSVGVPID